MFHQSYWGEAEDYADCITSRLQTCPLLENTAEFQVQRSKSFWSIGPDFVETVGTAESNRAVVQCTQNANFDSRDFAATD